ncbi:MAG: hypothetical protein WCS85_04195 [Candidatus Peribacteraceae bacterium]|jgi:hypothetical protein
MPLIISKNGKNAKRVNRTSFENEDELQRYIYENPESIPLYDIKEDIRLLVVAREFPTQSGPIDAIGVDKEGELYLVETKLYKNADKRSVVAQVLDYGASLWKHSSEDWEGFRSELEKQSQKKWSIPLQQKFQEFFGISEEETLALIGNLNRHLDEGEFKFVVLMDRLHDQLKDLILFINQNSKFSIFIAEMEYYKHEEYEILIPRLFGAEVKKDVTVSSRTSIPRVWDRESFFRELQGQTDASVVSKAERLFSFVESAGADALEFGVNSFKLRVESKDGVRKTVFFVNSNGRWNLVPDFWKVDSGLRKKYADLMVQAMPTLKRDRLDATYYEIRLDQLGEKDIEKLLKVFMDLIQELRASVITNV